MSFSFHDEFCGAGAPLNSHNKWLGFWGALQADWVIVCDVDEFLYDPRLKHYLRWARNQSITLLPVEGFQMVSDTFPKTGEVLPGPLPAASLLIGWIKP